MIIPIYQEDNGSQIRVEIIPLYKQIINKQPEFFAGTKFIFYYNQFKKDLPQIALSFMSICISIVFFVSPIINRYEKKKKNILFSLGIFAFSIGIWRITDIKFTSMLYYHNSKIIYYISMLMMYISAGALGFNIKNQFIKKHENFMKCIIIIYCSGCLSLIFMQMINLFDLHESLFVWHILLVIYSIIVAVLVVYETKKDKNAIKISSLIFITLCIIGVLIDLISYYVKGNSYNLFIITASLIIYSIFLGYISINNINEKANLDIQTGLYNKRRLKELFINYETITDSLGIIMFDLNGLKHINDTLGHNYGDILISEFAKILKVCIKHKGFVARYGGDEFVAVVKNADMALMKKIESHINIEVNKYNMRNTGIVMSYSMGYSLSKDYPEFSLYELLAKADEYMYEHKRKYYICKKK
ncbi:GGDEF domain-containing protein [Clostridium sp. SM-530-WT-3G]|uniref:diguanylate cyclase domain-containing protein n=1 Tax=Clostridium sp. SM-530-WT-3G TaxID=2725303 RepID=UPI00145C3BB6|nr:GGDEF domain-containing protein [Clostridium sp. SM-530-WT-3G]